MKFCQKCGHQLLDEAMICPGCGCITDHSIIEKPAIPEKTREDNVSIGLCLLSFLFPVGGITYWILRHKETPARALACGITGLISGIISFISEIFLSFLFFGILSGL